MTDKNSYDVIETRINNEDIILIETRIVGGEENVSNKIPTLEHVSSQVQNLIKIFSNTLTTPNVDKVEIEFGIEVAMKSGTLTALIVEGSGKGTIKVKCTMSRK